MDSKKSKPSDREENEISAGRLKQLREKLYSRNISFARRAAFSLSWMQEDGLDVLKKALFGDSPRKTKTAAAYGLRSMRGRMKKMAMKTLKQGSKNQDSDTRELCRNSLSMISARTPEKSLSHQKGMARKVEIREIPPKSRSRKKIDTKQKSD